MSYIAVILSLLMGSSSVALAQTVGGGGSATGGSPGYTGSTLSTGHIISGTAGYASGAGNAINQGATGDPGGASSVAQPPPAHDNAVDTPTANSAAKSLGNTDTGILKK